MHWLCVNTMLFAFRVRSRYSEQCCFKLDFNSHEGNILTKQKKKAQVMADLRQVPNFFDLQAPCERVK